MYIHNLTGLVSMLSRFCFVFFLPRLMMMPRQLLFIKSSLFSITVFDEKRKKCATYSNDGPKNVACNTRPRPHRKFVWVHWFAYVSRPSLVSCAGISSHSCNVCTILHCSSLWNAINSAVKVTRSWTVSHCFLILFIWLCSLYLFKSIKANC